MLSLVQKIKSFRVATRPESLLFCLSKREVTQRKRHPTWRLPGIHARQVREPGPGLSTAHPCAGEKESASCRFPLRGLSTPTHRRTGAPGRAAGHPGPHSVRPPPRRARMVTLVLYRLRSSWEITNSPTCPLCGGIGMSGLANHPTMEARQSLLAWLGERPEIHGRRDRHR